MVNALYARQSLDVKDSISTEMQIQKARNMVDPDDACETYIDKGFSGKNTNRPAFQQMMNDVEQGKIKRIIVYKLDRFSRSLMDFSITWEKLAKYGVDFMSVNEKFDTSTPIGKAMLFIIMVFAQLERETIVERVSDNYYSRAKLGTWPGGPPPYGFDNAKCQKNGRMVPMLQPNGQMETVKRIFDTYANREDISLGKIARVLHNEGIKNSDGTTHWTNVTLARMMRNPAYVRADADIFVYYKTLGLEIANEIDDFDGKHACLLVGKRGASTRQRKKISEAKLSIAVWEGQIDARTWLDCQTRLAANVQIQNSGNGKYSWLSGLMRCAYCDCNVKVVPYRSQRTGGIGRLRLKCKGHQDGICDQIIQLDADEVEEYVQLELEKILGKCCSQPFYENKEEMDNSVKIELQKIEQKVQNLIECIASGNASDATMQYINRQIAALNAQKEELGKKITQKKKVVFEKIEFDKLEFEEKKIVAKTYIEKVIISENGMELVLKM